MSPYKFYLFFCLLISFSLLKIKADKNEYNIINVENIQEYNFTINNTNQFSIFKYYNDIPENNYDLVFRLSTLYSILAPEIYVSMYIYFSSTDSPEIIKQNEENKFINYLYKCNNITDLGSLKEVWFNPTDDLKYINKGYYYILVNFENIENDDIFFKFSSSIKVFNTYKIQEIKANNLYIFDFGHYYKSPMIFKIPSTNEINNIYYEVSMHTSLTAIQFIHYKFFFYEGSNPRTDSNATLYQKHSFYALRSSNNTYIKNNTEYYIEYVMDNYRGQYGSSLMLDLISKLPLEVKKGRVYTITSFRTTWLKYCYLNLTSIKESKIIFHVYNTREYDFNYEITHINYEHIYLEEKDYDDFLKHIDLYEYNIYYQYTESVFIGKGLYYNEMFYSINKIKNRNILIFVVDLGFQMLNGYTPVETNIEIIEMTYITKNHNKKYSKTNGSPLYFNINVNDLSNYYKNRSIFIYTNNNYNLRVYESYINKSISEVEKISNVYENRKLVYIESQYNHENITNHAIIFSCKNDNEDFYLEVRFVDSIENLLVNQNYYLIKNETLERNVINNNYNEIYLINTYNELVSKNEYLTYYSSLIGDFEIHYIDLDKYNEKNIDNLISYYFILQNKYLIDAKNPFEENSKGELIYIKRKNNEQRNVFYLNRLNCQSYNQREIKYGDFLNICLKKNEKTILNLHSSIKGNIKYEIKIEGVPNTLNNTNIILYYSNTLLNNLTDFGIIEFGEVSVNEENNYFSLENNGNLSMIISFKINLLNGDVIYLNESLYKYKLNKDLVIFNIKDAINNQEEYLTDYIYQNINFEIFLKRKQMKFCIYELITSYSYLTYPPEISCSYDSDKFIDYLENIYNFKEFYTKNEEELSAYLNKSFYYMLIYIENDKLYNNSILFNNQYEYNINLQKYNNEKLRTTDFATKRSIIVFELPKYSSDNEFDSIAFQLIGEYNKKNYDIVFMINDEILTDNITNIQYDPINFYGNIILNNHENKNISIKLLSNNNDVLKIKEYNSKNIDYIFKPNFTEINTTILKNNSISISFFPYEEGIHNYDIYFIYKNVIDEYEYNNSMENGSYLLTFSNIFNLSNINNSICNNFSIMNHSDNNITNLTNFTFNANCGNGELYVLIYSTQVGSFNFINYYKPFVFFYSKNINESSTSTVTIIIIVCIISFLLICIISFLVFRYIRRKKIVNYDTLTKKVDEINKELLDL